MDFITVTESEDGVLIVDSRLIAEALGIEHQSFIRNADTHQATIERAFGVIRFAFDKPLKGSRGGRPTRFALLTESQSTFLMTLSQNTLQVVDAKVKLVKAFEVAKHALAQAEIKILQMQFHKALTQEQEDRKAQIDSLWQHVNEGKLKFAIETAALRRENGQEDLINVDGVDYFTISQYAFMLGINRVPYLHAKMLGREASKITREHYLTPIPVLSTPYNKKQVFVHAYPEFVLQLLDWSEVKLPDPDF